MVFPVLTFFSITWCISNITDKTVWRISSHLHLFTSSSYFATAPAKKLVLQLPQAFKQKVSSVSKSKFDFFASCFCYFLSNLISCRMVEESQCPYCRKKYKSSTWYKNHLETAHSGFVQPRGTLKRPICDEERPLQTPQLAADTSLASNLYSEEFDTIETNIAEHESELDVNATNSDVESLNYSDSEESTPWIGPPIPTTHPTAGRSIRHVIQHERSEDEMWSPFWNKTDFELARWFIEGKVPKDHIDRYFKKDLGPEGSSINSAYQLLEAVDELESGIGMKSWKEWFVSFSKTVR